LTSETYESTFGHLVGLLGWGISQSQGQDTGQHNTEKCRHTTMPPSGVKTMIPVFKWLKTTCLRPCGHWDQQQD